MISIQNISKSFDARTVLENLSLEIPKGKRCCIIGRSGCGKSVLLKIITGLMKPDSGKIVIDDVEVDADNKKELFKLRRRIGYVFQGAALFDSYDVYTNVVLSIMEQGETDDEVLEKEAKRVLSSVGLLPDLKKVDSPEFEKEWEILRKTMPSELSGGMRKRVGVARALVGSPDYIFYDEPTTGLDPITSEQIDKLILELDKTLEATSVIITHDLYSVYSLAEQVVLIEDGSILFEGTVEELKNSDDKIVVQFLRRYEQ
jgi:phospholipid/cholesterol/gamma-HCH transport system ATP-binding protein